MLTLTLFLVLFLSAVRSLVASALPVALRATSVIAIRALVALRLLTGFRPRPVRTSPLLSPILSLALPAVLIGAGPLLVRIPALITPLVVITALTLALVAVLARRLPVLLLMALSLARLLAVVLRATSVAILRALIASRLPPWFRSVPIGTYALLTMTLFLTLTAIFIAIRTSLASPLPIVLAATSFATLCGFLSRFWLRLRLVIATSLLAGRLPLFAVLPSSPFVVPWFLFRFRPRLIRASPLFTLARLLRLVTALSLAALLLVIRARSGLSACVVNLRRSRCYRRAIERICSRIRCWLGIAVPIRAIIGSRFTRRCIALCVGVNAELDIADALRITPAIDR